MTLFINACVRKNSRTKRIADALLSKTGGPYEEIRPCEISFPKADEAFLTARDTLIANGDFDNPLFDLARQFVRADEIIIASPFWDLSFPAALKQYFEQINVVGITFIYTPEGIPQGLCRAKRLTYVTTAGGNYAPDEYGFGYVKALAEQFYGIPDVRLIKAEGLDIDGADEEEILKSAIEKIGF